MEAGSPVNFEPRMTRIYTDGEGARQRLVKPSWRCVFKSLHKRACTGLLNRIAHSLRERPCFSRLARDEEIAKKAWCHAGR